MQKRSTAQKLGETEKKANEDKKPVVASRDPRPAQINSTEEDPKNTNKPKPPAKKEGDFGVPKQEPTRAEGKKKKKTKTPPRKVIGKKRHKGDR